MGSITLDFGSPGTYRVEITGNFPRIYFNKKGDRYKILTVQQWGGNPWTSMLKAFYGCHKLTNTALDAPNLSNVTDMSYMFAANIYSDNNLGGDLNSWDVSNVTNMSNLFASATAFNADLSSWDVSSVMDMSYMFAGTAFNGDLSSWNVSSVTDMSSMLNRLTNFNHDLSSWDVSSVTDMSGMFSRVNYTWDLSSWNVSNVTDMNNMFQASSFNQDLSSWNVSKVTNMSGMFYFATSFNGDLSAWDVSKVTNMNNMFRSATSFNQDLSSWDVSNVSNMSNMFDDSGLSTGNYDLTLQGWAPQTVIVGVELGASGLTYCAGAVAQGELVVKGWSFSGDIEDCSQTITFDALADKIYGDATFNLTASANSELPVSYISSNLAVATVSGSTVTIHKAGSTTITASRAADANYDLAPNEAQVLQVNVKALTIMDVTTFDKEYDGTTSATVGGSPYLLGVVDADADNVSINEISASGMFSDQNAGVNIPVTFSGYALAGTASGNYSLTQPSSTTASITTKAITVTADVDQSKVYGAIDPAFTYSAPGLVGGDALTGALSRAAGSDVGNYAVALGTLANANYSITFGAATDFAITAKTITVTADTGQSKVYGAVDSDFTYSVSPALVVGDAFTGTLSRVVGEDAGSYTIEVGTLSAGTNYSTSFTGADFVIDKAGQAITFAALATKVTTDGDFELMATGGVSGNAVTFISSDETVATITGNTVTIMGAGTTTITASQVGDANYNAASVDQELIVSEVREVQTITFTAIADQILEEGTLTLEATASSGLDVSYEVVSGSATVAGNVVTFTNLGEVIISASQVGSDAFFAADAIEQSFEVITVTSVEKDLATTINFYPNPAAGNYITIQSRDQLLQVEVLDMSGKQMMIEYNVQLDISQLKAGNYLLKVITASEVSVHQFIKK